MHPLCAFEIALWRQHSGYYDEMVYVCNMVNSAYYFMVQTLLSINGGGVYGMS